MNHISWPWLKQEIVFLVCWLSVQKVMCSCISCSSPHQHKTSIINHSDSIIGNIKKKKTQFYWMVHNLISPVNFWRQNCFSTIEFLLFVSTLLHYFFFSLLRKCFLIFFFLLNLLCAQHVLIVWLLPLQLLY